MDVILSNEIKFLQLEENEGSNLIRNQDKVYWSAKDLHINEVN